MPEVYISALFNSYPEEHTSNTPPSSYSKPSPSYHQPPIRSPPPARLPNPPMPPYNPPPAEVYRPPPAPVKKNDPNDIFGLFDNEEETTISSAPLDPVPMLQPTTTPLRPTQPNYATNFPSQPPLNPRPMQNAYNAGKVNPFSHAKPVESNPLDELMRSVGLNGAEDYKREPRHNSFANPFMTNTGAGTFNNMPMNYPNAMPLYNPRPANFNMMNPYMTNVPQVRFCFNLLGDEFHWTA